MIFLVAGLESILEFFSLIGNAITYLFTSIVQLFSILSRFPVIIGYIAPFLPALLVTGFGLTVVIGIIKIIVELL